MELIHHETQEGQLCAKHCLNTLLQIPVFDAIQLADIAQQLDCEEGRRIEDGGTAAEIEAWRRQPSNNMDDSGFFSVQVIMKALEVYGLTAQHWNHPSLANARKSPSVTFTAFICNLHEHWFTIRKIGRQWFNIDSCKSGPSLVSDTYLEVYLKQLELDGYSIFVVEGALPECAADAVLRERPAVAPPPQPRAVKQRQEPRPEVQTESVEEIRRRRLARLEGGTSSSSSSLAQQADRSVTFDLTPRDSVNSDEEADIERAIRLSLEESVK